jgi:hypothetical protein
MTAVHPEPWLRALITNNTEKYKMKEGRIGRKREGKEKEKKLKRGKGREREIFFILF